MREQPSDGLPALVDITDLTGLADALRALRRRHARRGGVAPVTYRNLAACTGWSLGAVAGYFGGRILPPTDRFDILVRLLGTSRQEQGALATARDRVDDLRRAVAPARPAPVQPPGDVPSFTGQSPAPAAVPAQRFASSPARPAQLPADNPAFAGRAAHLRELDLLLAPNGSDPATVIVWAIGGTAGIGKTTLAVRWAHRVADHFPDGQLYVNLRGFAPDAGPLTAAEGLRGFLAALGVPPERIPDDTDGLAALYRSALAGKRMLILLDNARDSQQVRPLLPGAPGCHVLVTSRNRLASLVAIDGARSLTLDVLSVDEARQLLARRLGAARVTGEPEAVQEIIRACARLPLALAIVAAHAATQANFPLAELTAGLRDARSALDALHGGDAVTDVRTVFSWSYAALSAPAARLFRLLGLHPAAEISAPAAASLAGAPAGTVRPLLGELVQAHLVVQHAPGRYSFHDLLRAYAAEQAHAVELASCRRAGLHRLLDHYVHTAHRAALMLNPAREPITVRPAPVQPGVSLGEIPDAEKALGWFDAERPALLAAVSAAGPVGMYAHGWQIAWTLVEFLDRRGHWHDWAATQTIAVHAAQELGDRRAEAQARRGIGTAHIRLHRYDEALAEFHRALQLFGEAGDPTGEVDTYFDLCAVSEGQGRIREALGHAAQAVDRYQAVGNQRGTAQALNALGWYHGQLGEYDRTLACCRDALALLAQVGDRHGQAESWGSIGYANHHLGRYQDATSAYERALRLSEEVGDRYGVGWLHAQLGDTHIAASDAQAARAAWQQALDIFDQLGHTDADDVQAKLSRSAVTPVEPLVARPR